MLRFFSAILTFLASLPSLLPMVGRWWEKRKANKELREAKKDKAKIDRLYRNMKAQRLYEDNIRKENKRAEETKVDDIKRHFRNDT